MERAWLLHFRKSNSYTQDVVARLCGVSVVTYNRWERGHAEPSPEQALALEGLFGLPADLLLGKDGTPSPDRVLRAFLRGRGF